MPTVRNTVTALISGAAVADKSRQAFDARTRFSDSQSPVEARPTQYYSEGERLNAERTQGRKDVTGEAAKSAWTGVYPEQEARNRKLSEAIERQIAAERVSSAENLIHPPTGPDWL